MLDVGAFFRTDIHPIVYTSFFLIGVKYFLLATTPKIGLDVHGEEVGLGPHCSHECVMGCKLIDLVPVEVQRVFELLRIAVNYDHAARLTIERFHQGFKTILSSLYSNRPTESHSCRATFSPSTIVSFVMDYTPMVTA